MIVVDANIFLAAIRSANGASNVLLREMIVGNLDFAVSTAVALEYEDVLKRPGILGKTPWLSGDDLDLLLDTVISKSRLVSPWFRFRPFLNDPKDDLYVECALAAGARTIVSNDKHFAKPVLGAFGISVVSAGTFVSGHCGGG